MTTDIGGREGERIRVVEENQRADKEDEELLDSR